MLIQNDLQPVSSSAIIRVGVILLCFVVAALVIARVYRLYFSPTTVDEFACKTDPAYHFKDPQRHPTDCY